LILESFEIYSNATWAYNVRIDNEWKKLNMTAYTILKSKGNPTNSKPSLDEAHRSPRTIVLKALLRPELLLPSL